MDLAVRFLEGSRIVEDGPFTAEAECVAGFGIIEATDLDEALAIVRSWPLGGYIEIRPLAQPRSVLRLLQAFTGCQKSRTAAVSSTSLVGQKSREDKNECEPHKAHRNRHQNTRTKPHRPPCLRRVR